MPTGKPDPLACLLHYSIRVSEGSVHYRGAQHVHLKCPSYKVRQVGWRANLGCITHVLAQYHQLIVHVYKTLNQSPTMHTRKIPSTLDPMYPLVACSVWKSSPRTGKRLQPNWTKTKQDQDQKRPFVGLLQSWSWSFHFGEIKKTEKNQFKPVFFRTDYVHINYRIGTIFGYFIIFLWNLFM